MTEQEIINKLKEEEALIHDAYKRMSVLKEDLANIKKGYKEELGKEIVVLAQEPFLSIEGESLRQGEPTIFLRFLGCNLRCQSDVYLDCHCDSEYTFKEGPDTVRYNISDLVKKLDSLECENLSITGGEPLINKGLYKFLEYIYEEDPEYDRLSCKYRISIETNGSVDISEIKNLYPDIHIIGDWKCRVAFGENANKAMIRNNLRLYRMNDALKFVVTKDDFDEVIEVLEKSGVYKKTNIYISPAWGCVDLKDVVDFVIENRKYGLNLSIQQHKLFNLKAKELMEVGKTSAEDIWL